MCFFVSWYCQAFSICNTSKSKETQVSEVLLAKLVAGLVKNILTFATWIFVIVFEITTELCPERIESSPHWHALILSVNIVIFSCLRMFQFFSAVKLIWRKCFSNMTGQDNMQKINFFIYWENIFITVSSLFKVMVFGDVTLCSVVVTDINVLEKHVVEVTLKMDAAHSLETIMSALLYDVVPEDQIFACTIIRTSCHLHLSWWGWLVLATVVDSSQLILSTISVDTSKWNRMLSDHLVVCVGVSCLLLDV